MSYLTGSQKWTSGSPARFGSTRGAYRDQVPCEATDRLTQFAAKMDAVRCTKEFVEQCEDASAGCARMPVRGAYSARSISAGAIRTAWVTAGNDARDRKSTRLNSS